MSLEELRECQSELEECRAELDEESERLSACLSEEDPLRDLARKLRELPFEIADWLSREHDVHVAPGEIEDLIEESLRSLGVNLDALRRVMKQWRRPFDEREAERFEAWAETYAETATRAEIEYELSVCIELLESCREEVEGVRAEADECEEITEEGEEIVSRVREGLAEELAFEIADYLWEIHDIRLSDEDERELERLIQEHLGE
jgi:DNA repair ATPase RecN